MNYTAGTNAFMLRRRVDVNSEIWPSVKGAIYPYYLLSISLDETPPKRFMFHELTVCFPRGIDERLLWYFYSQIHPLRMDLL